MPDRLRIDHHQVIAQTVSLTLRMPPPYNGWHIEGPVLIEGYGYRCKAIVGDDDYRLITLVRDSSVDAEDEKPRRTE